ncbi:unnamed protein product [Closterium sp. NIES-53]
MELGKKNHLLSAGLRAYTREERKRVRAAMAHLEEEVELLRHKVMRHPADKRAYSKLVCKKAHLEAYQVSCKERLQVLAGIRVEMDGEVPSPYLSAKVKMRKKHTQIQEVSHQGVLYQGTKRVLEAVAEYSRVAFKEIAAEEVELGGFSEGPTLTDAEAAQLDAEWSEQEVKEALASFPKGKSPGQDGLPVDFFILHWDLPGAHVMQFVKQFVEAARMPEELSSVVTVLLHKKGPTDQLGNYRPITLLTVMYKLVTKIDGHKIEEGAWGSPVEGAARLSFG